MSAPAEAGDLEWWLTLAPTLEWTWAATYADSAPHWYVVRGRTPGLTPADFRRVARVVRTYGEPGKFWSMTNLYLFTDDRMRKFWCIWDRVPDEGNIGIINLATTERVYGPQRDFDAARVRELSLPRSVGG